MIAVHGNVNDAVGYTMSTVNVRTNHDDNGEISGEVSTSLCRALLCILMTSILTAQKCIQYFINVVC